MTRKVKIVADSSANVLYLKKTAFASVPLKIITDETEFVDTKELDVDAMVAYFDNYKSRSKTSCPNPNDWVSAFGDADDVFCVAITSGLSGSYNAACAAKQLFEAEHEGKRVFVIDSLSAGPELKLIIEKLEELIESGMPFEEICDAIKKYQETTGLLFMLASLKNFAANGRVSPVVARLANVLGIRIVGKASDEGTLEPLDKCRGEEKAAKVILNRLQELGLKTGKVSIAHCENESAAVKLKLYIKKLLPQVSVEIHKCRGLCCYYAEKGGLLVGFEKE